MSVAESLYVSDGDAFVGTTASGGPWRNGGQSGGAVLALLGHVIEDVPTLTTMSLTRLSVDIVRPVPVGERLLVTSEIVREGKKIQVLDVTITAADMITTRARALRIRDLDVTTDDGLPRSTSDVNPFEVVPGPDVVPVADGDGVSNFLRFGVELRRSVEPVNGAHVAWCRLRVPVVADEVTRPTSRATLLFDLANLIGVDLDPARATSINPDVSGHLSRLPVGEWVAFTGNTYYAPSVGHGLSTALLSDQAGVFGVASTSQIVAPAPRA